MSARIIHDCSKATRASDIPDEAVLEAVRACNEARCEGDETWGWHSGRPGYKEADDIEDDAQPHWAIRWDIGKALNDPPEKVLLAKLKNLVKRGKLDGCACGCRGDFTIPDIDVFAKRIPA